MPRVQRVPIPTHRSPVCSIAHKAAFVQVGTAVVVCDFDQCRLPTPRVVFMVSGVDEPMGDSVLGAVIRQGVAVGNRVLSAGILNESTVADDVCVAGTDQELAMVRAALPQFYLVEADWVVRATLRHVYWSIEKQATVRVEAIGR